MKKITLNLPTEEVEARCSDAGRAYLTCKCGAQIVVPDKEWTCSTVPHLLNGKWLGEVDISGRVSALLNKYGQDTIRLSADPDCITTDLLDDVYVKAPITSLHFKLSEHPEKRAWWYKPWKKPVHIMCKICKADATPMHFIDRVAFIAFAAIAKRHNEAVDWVLSERKRAAEAIAHQELCAKHNAVDAIDYTDVPDCEIIKFKKEGGWAL